MGHISIYLSIYLSISLSLSLSLYIYILCGKRTYIHYIYLHTCVYVCVYMVYPPSQVLITKGHARIQKWMQRAVIRRMSIYRMRARQFRHLMRSSARLLARHEGQTEAARKRQGFEALRGCCVQKRYLTSTLARGQARYRMCRLYQFTSFWRWAVRDAELNKTKDHMMSSLVMRHRAFRTKTFSRFIRLRALSSWRSVSISQRTTKAARRRITRLHCIRLAQSCVREWGVESRAARLHRSLILDAVRLHAIRLALRGLSLTSALGRKRRKLRLAVLRRFVFEWHALQEYLRYFKRSRCKARAMSARKRHAQMVGYLFEWLLVTTNARQLRCRRQLFMVYHLYYRCVKLSIL